MANFDETSGIVPCVTPWGQWWQTMDEVYIEIHSEGLTGKQVKCTIKPRHITVLVKGETLIEGELLNVIKADDSVWTIEDHGKSDQHHGKIMEISWNFVEEEDKKLLRICLPKSISTAEKCWISLLKNEYVADPYTFDQMEKKLTLQRFQYENPGMNFSNADISGNYHGGGPQLPTT